MKRYKNNIRDVRRIWWIDPAWCLLGLILPIYLLSSTFGGPIMSDFGSLNFLDSRVIFIGSFCIVIMAIGCKLGELFGLGSRRPFTVTKSRFDRVFMLIFFLTVAAHVLMLGAIIANPQSMLATFQAERGAIYNVKAQVSRFVGLTSLTNLAPVVMSMSAARKVFFGERMPKRYNKLFWVLCFLIFLRGFGAAERLALLEAIIAYFLPIVLFSRKRSLLIKLLPFFGIIGVFILFSAGEYTRSWPYYKDQYDSFLQFSFYRILGYISVASNTSAGLFTKYEEIGRPSLTAAWINRLPFYDRIEVPNIAEYFQLYGNEEYNNPGGVIAGLIDYGFPLGLLYYLFAGIYIGYLFAKFVNKRPIGLFGYPTTFIGIPILTQFIYWGDPRYVTPFVAFTFISIYFSFSGRSRVAMSGQVDNQQWTDDGRAS